MEAQGKGAFIPAKLTAKEAVEARSAVISAPDLERLRLLVEEKIAGMASLLAEGRVEACPVLGGPYRPCEYCDYRSVCGFEEGDPVRPVGDEAGAREQDTDSIRGSGEDGRREWTQNQQKAIRDRGGTLLLSAAAGTRKNRRAGGKSVGLMLDRTHSMDGTGC
jgi:hypothetical protein